MPKKRRNIISLSLYFWNNRNVWFWEKRRFSFASHLHDGRLIKRIFISLSLSLQQQRDPDSQKMFISRAFWVIGKQQKSTRTNFSRCFQKRYEAIKEFTVFFVRIFFFLLFFYCLFHSNGVFQLLAISFFQFVDQLSIVVTV